MYQQFLLAVAAIVLTGAAAGDDEQLIEKERAKLDGQWIVHSAEYGGESTDEDRKQTWHFKRDQLTTYIDSKKVQVLKVDIQPAQQPKYLDLVPVKADLDDAAKVVSTRTNCLYSIEDDELKIAFTFKFSPGTADAEKRRALEHAKTRPKDFDTKRGDVAVLTLRRQRPHSR